MSKFTFLEALRQLIQSKDYEQYQFHRGILTSGIYTDDRKPDAITKGS